MLLDRLAAWWTARPRVVIRLHSTRRARFGGGPQLHHQLVDVTKKLVQPKINLKKQENFSHQNHTSEEPQKCTNHHVSHHKLPSKNAHFSRNPSQKSQQNGEKATSHHGQKNPRV
jgi:hypothetical protein